MFHHFCHPVYELPFYITAQFISLDSQMGRASTRLADVVFYLFYREFYFSYSAGRAHDYHGDCGTKEMVQVRSYHHCGFCAWRRSRILYWLLVVGDRREGGNRVLWP